jgi:hypothetical protein
MGTVAVFFSEEKKQKTFASLSRFSPATYAKDIKVFWFFSSEKNCFLLLRLPLEPSTQDARHCQQE